MACRGKTKTEILTGIYGLGVPTNLYYGKQAFYEMCPVTQGVADNWTH